MDMTSTRKTAAKAVTALLMSAALIVGVSTPAETAPEPQRLPATAEKLEVLQ